ncbi:hypothetical protein VAE308_1270107 [Vibrio aestuarianus]|uniref:Uncharacterized protein n=1 Tax=Vibrio aestuarianus TaxID=28171 RepID=A0ABM9FJZ1_9VIBR|nr:hypothetical protein VAE063_1010228 [Vibrio aestuarianus]CAH8224656.1 hypothetical protein VAE308_1270107 [Vibrio aestuarianus]
MGLDVKIIDDINGKIIFRVLSFMERITKVSATGLPLLH